MGPAVAVSVMPEPLWPVPIVAGVAVQQAAKTKGPIDRRWDGGASRGGGGRQA